MNAVLSANRKAGLCPACHRPLAVRSRLPDGSHRIYLDRDWKVSDDGRRYERNWHRFDVGLPLTRHASRSDLGSPLMPAPQDVAMRPLRCGCGLDIMLDEAALEATFAIPDDGLPPVPPFRRRRLDR